MPRLPRSVRDTPPLAAALLRQWLAREGVSQNALARELGMSPGAIAAWLAGTATPSLDTAARLQDRTGIQAVMWVRFAPKKSRKKSA